jgi:hypothetical protein
MHVWGTTESSFIVFYSLVKVIRRMYGPKKEGTED